MSFPLFTSIKPPADTDELAYLRDCLASWRRAGFEAVTVNGPAEIAALLKLDLPVKFSAMPTDGKPRIGAILAAIRARGAPFAGIINGDCKLIGYPDFARNLLAAGLDRKIVVGWRMDVGNGKPAASFGFDAFFLDTTFLPEDDAGFCISDPWWDYWFPLACEVTGANIETLPAPLLTHKVHPLNYTHRKEIGGCIRFWAALKRWYVDGRNLPSWPFSDFYRHRVTDTFSPEQVDELSGLVRPWIHRNRARAAIMPGMDEIETMLRLGGEALLADTKASHLRAEIAALRHSISWRITAPLRKAALVARSVSAIKVRFPGA